MYTNRDKNITHEIADQELRIKTKASLQCAVS